MRRSFSRRLRGFFGFGLGASFFAAAGLGLSGAFLRGLGGLSMRSWSPLPADCRSTWPFHGMLIAVNSVLLVRARASLVEVIGKISSFVSLVIFRD